jgi:hypothetical protein
VTRLRQRITHLEAPCKQLTEAETLQRGRQLMGDAWRRLRPRCSSTSMTWHGTTNARLFTP